MKSSSKNFTHVPSNSGSHMPVRRRHNVDQAAQYVGLSVSKMNKLRGSGGGAKYYKLDHRVVYDQADLDAWVASRAQTNTSQNAA